MKDNKITIELFYTCKTNEVIMKIIIDSYNDK